MKGATVFLLTSKVGKDVHHELHERNERAKSRQSEGDEEDGRQEPPSLDTEEEQWHPNESDASVGWAVVFENVHYLCSRAAIGCLH